LCYQKLNRGKIITRINLIIDGVFRLIILNDILLVVKKILFKLTEGIEKKTKRKNSEKFGSKRKQTEIVFRNIRIFARKTNGQRMLATKH
jgi:hypothetical protein